MTRCPRCQRRLPPKGECATHGRPTAVVTVDDAMPQVLAPPGYSLGRHIAIGGSSLVYEVTSPKGTPAILKFGRWNDRDLHERFEREATILRALGAPLTPTYIGHGALDGWPYLLMEQAPGEPLAMWMSRSTNRGALGEIVSILLRVVRAVSALHDRGYIHRDLKPENVVITSQDTRLLDFGLAARESEGLVQTGLAAGTVHYIAPEQLRIGSTIDRRADIYSLGVIAYEMIAGEPPFTGERRAIEYQHQVARPPSLRDVREVPQELEDLVTSCLAKQPEARPQTMQALAEQLAHASSYIQTLKGVGAGAMKTVLGARDSVVLAWIEGGDPIAIARTINDVHGMIVRSRPGAILAVFAAQFHDAPLAVALAACRTFAHDRCRVVIHVTNALVRRSAQGKPGFYGPDIEKPASWAPTTPFTGLVLTAAAAPLATTPVAPAADVGGFFRDLKRDRTDSTDARREPRLTGRDRLLQNVAAIAGGGGMLIGLFGAEGTGKTRMTNALVERLQKQKREVIAIRGRRRLLGDRPDDDRLLEALGGEDDLLQALIAAGQRRVVLVIDNANYFSDAAQRQLLRNDLDVARIVTSRTPLFEVGEGEKRRLAFELQPLSFADAEALLRELLEPARLIPEVLLQRMALRGAGNPGLLVALARDIKHRGGIRRQDGGDDWYVAADEIDTLAAPPSAAWLAARGLDGLAPELAPVLRMASALGPKFTADELAGVLEMNRAEVVERVRWLVREGEFAERNDWYEFVDTALQDAIYEHVLDERSLVHGRALRYWLGHRIPNLVGWLARVSHHAMGSGDTAAAAACSTILAREARKRGEDLLAAQLEQRALATLVSGAPTAISSAISALDEP